MGTDAGSAGLLRGSKGTSWEGGTRVPFLARWPGHVPAGTVSADLATAVDVLPTVAGIAGELGKAPATPPVGSLGR